MVQHTGLDAIPFFTISGLRFATDVKGDARRRHQVSFVSRIDERAAVNRPPAQHPNRLDAPVAADHTGLPIEPFVSKHGDVVFRHELIKHLFGHVWFKNPHRPLLSVNGRRRLALIPVLLTSLPFPGIH